MPSLTIIVVLSGWPAGQATQNEDHKRLIMSVDHTESFWYLVDSATKIASEPK